MKEIHAWIVIVFLLWGLWYLLGKLRADKPTKMLKWMFKKGNGTRKDR